jgi:anaerobic selenocysteine-containing dehydrogenase
MNHWYHMDMNYRGVINMLVMCGCVGQSGGGWSHYVGPGEAASATGWLPLAFGSTGSPAAAAELDLLLLRAHRSVALRNARRRGNSLADRASQAIGTAR